MNRERRRMLLAAIGLIPTSWMLRRERAIETPPQAGLVYVDFKGRIAGPFARSQFGPDFMVNRNGRIEHYDLKTVRGSLRAIPHESNKTPTGGNLQGR